MKTSKHVILVVVFLAGVLTAGALAEISPDRAVTVGEESLKRSIEQSYHYRVEYDTVVVVPVHSKTVWKNDFYLLYFLKDDYFQVEMEVDRETGKSTILAMGKMSPPYHELHTGTFNHRYFNADSIIHHASVRHRVQQDSARLSYFGVIPKLGKRGVIWETFSTEGITYISIGGANYTLDQLIDDLNTKQQKAGNFIADSLRMIEILAEIDRLKGLSDAERRELKLPVPAFDSAMTALTAEREGLIRKFPVLRRQFPLGDEPDSTK